MNKRKVSWEEVESFVEQIKSLQEKEHFTGVYGLPRGGLVLAVMISNKLNIPMLMAPTAGCIIVDDIADTGRSLYHYTINETQKNKYFIATMYYRYRSTVIPDYYRTHETGDDWLVFPWEA